MQAVRVLIAGRVQGVGFRFFVEAAARDLRITGWVRNLPDGRVEAFGQGDPHAMDAWLQKLRKGPLVSRIDDFQIRPETASPKYSHFAIIG